VILDADLGSADAGGLTSVAARIGRNEFAARAVPSAAGLENDSMAIYPVLGPHNGAAAPWTFHDDFLRLLRKGMQSVGDTVPVRLCVAPPTPEQQKTPHSLRHAGSKGLYSTKAS